MEHFQYALYKYNTINIGDDIQSIAARRFLPSIDYEINRDHVGEWRSHDNIKTKLIMNGWYMHSPYSWPPKDPNLEPLLISMCFSPLISDGKRSYEEIFFSKDGTDFLRKYGPVGARDLYTKSILQKHGIDSYFSGCLTLTLNKDERIQKSDYILAVDISDDVYNMLVTNSCRRVIRFSPYCDISLKESDRYIVAQYVLTLYQSAHSIITTRLHTIMPALAFETPAILLTDYKNYEKNRFSGLVDLTRHASEKDYLNNYEIFDADKAEANPDQYKEIRNSLISKCKSFTGYDSNNSYLSIDPSLFYSDTSFVATFAECFSHRKFKDEMSPMFIRYINFYRTIRNVKNKFLHK